MAKDVCVASGEDLNHYFDKHVSLSQEDKSESSSIANAHINTLLELINEKDPRFSKEPISVGSASQGLKVGTANEFDVNVRLKNLPRTAWSYDKRPKCHFVDECGGAPYPERMAESSIRTRRSQTKRYFKFCSIHWDCPVPAGPYLMCRYIDHLERLKPTTIRNYVYGVSFLHRINGCTPTFMSDPVVRYKLGMKRFSGDVKRLHSPAKTESEDEGYISIMNPPQEWSDLSTDNTLSPQLVRQRFKRLLKKVVEENRELSEVIEIDRLYHGPAITIQISVQGLDHPIDVDFSPMIESEAGFPCWVQWPHPDTAWPSKEKKEEVRKSGVNLVPKGDEMWLISYSKAERELRKGIDNDTCRIKCHRIMKKLREDVWCKAPASKKTLTSYHLKNLLFHECEKYPDDGSWSNDRIAERFHGMLINLIECLRGGKLDMYMDRKINLLKGKEGEALDKVLTNIIRFWNKYLQPEEH